MKIAPLFPIAMLSLACLLSAQDDKGQPGPAPQPDAAASDEQDVPQWAKEFNAMDEKKRAEYIGKFAQAEALFQQKRIIECLRMTEDLEKIFSGNPGLYNLRGACYIEIRDVAKALDNFLEARKIDPTNTSVKFNIAETYFVKHDYAKAIDEFTTIMNGLPDDASLFIKSLLHFKIYISYLKLGKDDEAGKIAALYNQMDDVPFYYCAKSIKALHEGDKEAGQAAYISAITIFQNSGMLQPFSDAMQESGLLPSMSGQTISGK